MPQPNQPFFAQQPQHQQQQLNHFPSRHEPLYSDPIPLSQPGDHYASPHAPFQEFDDTNNIKLEDNGSLLMPSQNFYRTSSGSSASPSPNMCHPMTMSYLSPHSGLPVQHTDDAASKETQYLRRRCFNCHTTEPPSWRRSTLNPGKIVCNKCGLYERTHLRPRPLRFDELRAGNKARKQNKRTMSPKSRLSTAAAAGTGGAPGSPGQVKKEPREFGLVRRSSVSSTSSALSSSGASDWDDNGKFLLIFRTVGTLLTLLFSPPQYRCTHLVQHLQHPSTHRQSRLIPYPVTNRHLPMVGVEFVFPTLLSRTSRLLTRFLGSLLPHKLLVPR
jgi:hypothetical protein